MKYIKELDAVRGLAILSVLVDHWFPTNSIFFKGAEIINAPNIFFTISGFLITKILLGDRAKAEQYAYGKGVVFKNFFFKRVLRIFPPYYLLLFLVYLINKVEVINYGPYLTFMSNYYIYDTKVWGQITHLWSMAVEEQFYLIWPWLILFSPKKWLPYTILAFAAIGIISQRFLPDNDFSPILTFSCFDALALGAFLSWLITRYPYHLPKIYRILSILAAISLVLFIKNQVTDRFYTLSSRTLTAIMVTWLLAYFITKPNPARRLSFIFKNKQLITIGKMSYGIYLYHSVLPFYSYLLYEFIFSFIPVPRTIWKHPYVYIAENFVLLLLISWLSWKFFETPILNLKKHFNNPKLQKPATAAAIAEAALPQAESQLNKEGLQPLTQNSL
jgi:peptidoglycan/LPS O-acetylase OafA/YrhL